MNKTKKIAALLVAAVMCFSLMSVFAFADDEAAEDGLLIYYSFDDADDLGADNSGNGHNAAIEGDVTASEGVHGGAAKLDGTTGAIIGIVAAVVVIAAIIIIVCVKGKKKA